MVVVWMWAEVPSQVVVRVGVQVEKREQVWERERERMNGARER